ncbi:hypothetical protein HJFPF1_05733 [Paramyrothecium foliicola]|nr:hypothetical protein HJFPF1_05733 [Paramyrothecium foliicola]
MEPVSLSLSVLAVVGTFKTCIDLFSSYRAAGRDHEILTAKLHVEKAILLQWAHRVRLLEPDYDARLDDPLTLEPVATVLSSIRHLMEESSSLQNRYGAQSYNTPQNPDTATLQLRVAKISQARTELFENKFKALQIRTGHENMGSTMNKLRWVVTDRDKFRKLLDELSHFITKLNQLVPEAAHKQISHMETMAREDLAAISNLKALRVFQTATSKRYDIIERVVEDRLAEVCQQNILNLIWFRSMDDRRDGVASPHPETFNWALKPSSDDVAWDDLSEWLRNGTGIYWICGKAGSGKSTLMKFLFYHQETGKLLKEWSRPERLTSGSFFFWNLGTSQQRSLEGLSRAIIYHVLDAEPRLSSKLLPRLWQETLQGVEGGQDPPSRAEMTLAFEILARSDLQQHFCFFIDGLDEFTGNHLEGVILTKMLIRNPRIKILLSSRPIPSCVNSLALMPKLKLQDLTRVDIEKYVRNTVGSHSYMVELMAFDGENPDVLIEQLVEKAAGVFLWVVLACNSLLQGFAAYDCVEELLQRVDELPPELDDLFRHMLDSVEPRYHDQTAKMLRMCYQRQITSGCRDEMASLYTIGLAILDSCNFSCSSSGNLKTLSHAQQLSVCTPMEGRLRSRCGGLLELRMRSEPLGEGCFCNLQSHDPLVHSTVDFMHRTVFEFLDRPEIWSTASLRIRDSSFNANAALAIMNFQICRLFLQRKTVPDGFLADGIQCAQLADSESSDSGFAILPKLQELISVMWKHDKRLTSAYLAAQKNGRDLGTEDARSLLVAVESGMFNCVRYYLPRVDEATLPFPLLYSAIRKPIFWRGFRTQTSEIVVRYLISNGALPNKPFINQEGLTTTPWRDWLRELHRMYKFRFFATVAITEEFIKGGALLHFNDLEPVDAILQKHLSNISSSFAEGREMIRQGGKLLECINEARELKLVDSCLVRNQNRFRHDGVHLELGSNAKKKRLRGDAEGDEERSTKRSSV